MCNLIHGDKYKEIYPKEKSLVSFHFILAYLRCCHFAYTLSLSLSHTHTHTHMYSSMVINSITMTKTHNGSLLCRNMPQSPGHQT